MLLLPDTVTLHEASDTMRLLSQAMRTGQDGEVVVDASALRQFDTSVLAVLLECRRLAQAGGRAFSLREAPSKLSALATLYGVGELLLTPTPGARA